MGGRYGVAGGVAGGVACVLCTLVEAFGRAALPKASLRCGMAAQAQGVVGSGDTCSGDLLRVNNRSEECFDGGYQIALWITSMGTNSMGTTSMWTISIGSRGVHMYIHIHILTHVRGDIYL